jgi:hypothetical protein
MVLALMGIGGVVMAGFTQDAKKQVDHQKYIHNKRVLEEAKQALLQFAYNYPETNQLGPGRLPCADTDNDGTPNSVFGPCTQLGRFPWNQQNLNLYDIRDADGQRLWYAVSSNFATQGAGAGTVNSDSFGTITIRDQVGNFIYDASGGGDGVAAVIIAPGAETARNGVPQDRSVANADDPFDTVADTDPGIINPVNYLDRFFGIEDNAVFGQGTANGFIFGRVDDLAAGSILVNDQIAIITAEEVIEVAQRAALQTYQTAINNYRDNIRIDTPGFDAYPWLDDYATTDLTVYDADVGTRLGRVPSIFGDYFIDTNVANTRPIRSALTMILDIDGFVMSETVPASGAPDIFFRGGGLPNDGNLSTSFNSGYTFVRRFWDGHDTNVPSAPADGIWEPCPVVTGTEEDCNQDGANNFIYGTDSVDWMKVREVTVTFNNGLNPFEFQFGDQMATPLVYTAPTAGGHATVTAEYNNNTGYLSVTWSQDDDFQSSFGEMPAGNNGTLTFNVPADSLTVGLTYYPELPNWLIATEDDWHDSLQMAYAAGFQPGSAGACTTAVDCLSVINIAGIVDNKVAVLTLAADHNFVDEGADGYSNDLVDIFDVENDDADDAFDNRAGNDQILVVR